MAFNTRETIVVAAKELFAERGYHGVTVEDIGNSLGLTGPSIYKHVGGKMDLLIAVFDYVTDSILAFATPICESGSPPEAVLDRLIDLHIEFVLSDPTYLRIYHQEQQSLPPERFKTQRSKAAQYIRLWDRQLAQACPSMDPDERFVVVRAAFAVIEHVGSRIEVKENTALLLHNAAKAALFSQAC